MEGKRIKLLWHFTGPDAQKTAEHFVIHLNEYLEHRNLKHETGVEPDHVPLRAFMIIPQDEMITHRDALKPVEGEYVD